jgi:putative transposase
MSNPPSQRRRRFETENQPRFLTFSCYRRLSLLQNDKVKQLLVDQIRKSRQETHFDLHAWVIMPEHVHLLITPGLPDNPIPRVLDSIKTPVARQVTQRWKDLNAKILDRIRLADGKTRFWQKGGGYDRNIRDEEEYREKCDYIHNNPVKRGLVTSPLDWPWSSANYYAGITHDILDLTTPD